MGPGVLIDTNILIDMLAGREPALEAMRRHPDRAISIVTWIEAVTGLRADEIALRKAIIENFEVIALREEIAEEAILLRRTTRLKLPDAIILATAHVEKRVLLTRNTRDFQAGRSVEIPYRL